MTHLIDKDALDNILRGLWKEDDGKNSEHRIMYNKALQDVQTAVDFMQEESKTDWLQELQEKLGSLSKEDFEKVMAKYSRYGEEEPVSEVWHDANTLPTNYEIKDILVVYNQYGREYLHLYWEDGVYSDAQGLSKYNWKYVEKWAYIEDLLKLDNSCYLKKNLQEEPVSEDLEKASKEWLKPQLDKSYVSYGEDKMMELTHFDGYAMLDAIEFGAQWKHEQMMKNAIEGEWWRCAVVLPAKYMNTDDIRSVKIIIIENN